MRLPPRLAAPLAWAAARALAATWRVRLVGPSPAERLGAAERMGAAARSPRSLPPAIYAFWHAHQLPLAVRHAGQGAVVLTSRHRDGEIVSRLLERFGYRTARGSSSRGGAAGLRAMIRAGRAGRPLGFTPDGPRGPARRCKAGVVRAAAETGLPIVPIGIAADCAWRLRSWDRFLVPRPAAVVGISYGPPMVVPPETAEGRSLARWAERVGAAIDREAERCERAVGRPGRAGLRGRAPAPDRGGGAVVSGAPAGGRVLERRVRAAWREGPGPLLRGASALFGTGADLRNWAYESGVLASYRAPIPVVSVGGLTVGGSGKTPMTATVADWLGERGLRVAIVTRGYPDELALHRRRRPEALVIGHPDRRRAVEAAAAEGAEVAVLDDGFQHRRLARDLDLLLVDLDAFLRAELRRLPGGPFRDRLAEVARADAVVVSRRAEAAEDGCRLADWLARRLPGIPVARLALEPGGLAPANAAAEAVAETGAPPHPALALTGIMKPRLFFAQLDARRLQLDARVALPDHAAPDEALLDGLARRAGSRGLVCTEKDVAGLRERLPEGVPLWFLEERLRWEAGEEPLRARVAAAAEGRAPARGGRPERAVAWTS